MTHPLTDEICLEITNRPYMIDTRKDDMRAVADWQLKQCLEFLRTHPFHERDDYECLAAHAYAQLMEEAMRPTTYLNHHD
jgi:hypothetical protein